MRRRSMLATLILILAFALPAAAAAADPPAPVPRHLYRMAGLPISGPAEVVQFLFEFAPGAATPPHTHPGLTLGTVLEGEVTFEMGGAAKVYKVGETIVERPGEVGLARNATAATTRIAVSMVVPQGAAPSTPQPGGPAPAPPAPVARYLYRTAAVIPAGAYEVAHAVLDFAPGAQTPMYTHAGQIVVTVLAGQNTFMTAGTTTVYQVGESFVELPGAVGQARNAGTAPLTVFATFLLPPGAPLSVPIAPGLPSTGAGGGSARPPAGWLVLAAAAALVAGGGLLRRRARRA
jgi:quercetin dioxygenase-like cupin family protein